MITVFKFFGQKVFIESTGNKQIDADLKVLFMDSYITKKPVEMRREDVKRVLAWSAEARLGQGALFEVSK